MEIIVHTLATDTDMGTQSYSFATEKELLKYLYEEVIENSWIDEDEKPTFDDFCNGDTSDYIENFRKDLDTYSWDFGILKIPLWNIIRDTIRLHPLTKKLRNLL